MQMILSHICLLSLENFHMQWKNVFPGWELGWLQISFLIWIKLRFNIFGPKEYRNNSSNLTLDLDGVKVLQSQLVKNLGVTMDPDLSFEYHIKQITRTAFFHLRNIAKIQKFLWKDDAEKLIHAIVTSRLNYCNVLFSGLPITYLNNLQRVCDEPMTDRLGPMGRDNSYGEREGGGTSVRGKFSSEKMAAQCGQRMSNKESLKQALVW